MGCLIAFLNTMEFRGTNFLLPIMLQRIYHYTPFQTGLFFLPPALVMGATSILAGRLSDTIQPKLLLIVGLLGLTYVSFQFCSLDVWATTGVLLGLIVLRRGAQAFCHSPLTSSTLHGVPEDQVRMASGIFNLHRTLGGTVGVALSATLMAYREDVHTLILSQRQALYPLGTEVATDAIRGVLMQDGEPGVVLAQKTAGSCVRSYRRRPHWRATTTSSSCSRPYPVFVAAGHADAERQTGFAREEDHEDEDHEGNVRNVR